MQGFFLFFFYFFCKYLALTFHCKDLKNWARLFFCNTTSLKSESEQIILNIQKPKIILLPTNPPSEMLNVRKPAITKVKSKHAQKCKFSAILRDDCVCLSIICLFMIWGLTIKPFELNYFNYFNQFYSYRRFSDFQIEGLVVLSIIFSFSEFSFGFNIQA